MKINFYLKEGQIVKDKSIAILAEKYLEKSKNNLITLKILSKIQEDKKLRERLNIPADYSTYEWIVVTGYYAMYTACIGFISKNRIQK